MRHVGEEQLWWDKSSGRTRAALLADPRGKVPGELIPEVVAAGGLVAGAYWVESERTVDGFELPDSYRTFIERLALGIPGL
jgi:hypothetical protein